MDTQIAFFGGEPLGVPTLEALKAVGITPNLIVCNPDRPAGRGQALSSPPVKVWANQNNITVYQPDSYQHGEAKYDLSQADWDLFVVVAYNFILPNWLLKLPKQGVINVHPSLLPKLRGASPIRTAIKDDSKEAVGVSIMLMDEKMDHGPILRQEALDFTNLSWPMPGPKLDTILAERGGKLLADTIPLWLSQDIKTTEQDHAHATYCGRFKKEDAELHLNPLNLPTGIEAKAALHHIYAWQGIGDSFFVHNDKRVKIKEADRTPDGTLRILRITPAGKAEMAFEQYLQTIANT